MDLILQDKLTKFFNRELGLSDSDQTIQRSSDLFEDGILDSIRLLKTAAYLEEEFKIKFSPYDLSRENFRDLHSIRSLVFVKQSENK